MGKAGGAGADKIVSYSSVSVPGSPSYPSKTLRSTSRKSTDDSASPTENSTRTGGTLHPGTNSPENGTSLST
jgi:hypothetical protein